MRLNFSSKGCEPAWIAPQQISRSHVPQFIISWLLDTGSLTQRLIAACQGHLEVQVLDQALCRPMLSEAQALAVPVHELAWVRQVHLLCNNKPLVFARTVIPIRSLMGPRRRLIHLGSRPLGALLFADKSMRRGAMQIARLTPQHAMFPVAIRYLRKRPAAIWGRRSVFYLGGSPLLVSEVFLPKVAKIS